MRTWFFPVCSGRFRMPRIGFLGAPVTEEDKARAAEIISHASGYSDTVLRELAQLEAFVRVNRFTEEKNEDIFALFGAQWVNGGRAASSLAAVFADFKKFAVNPHRINEARARVARFRLYSGVERLAKGQERTFHRKLLPECLAGVPQRRPDDDKEAERIAFWCLLCVTGARPENLAKVHRLTVTPEGVEVTWGVRKVRSGVKITYAFAWTRRPPAWVLARWANFEQAPWPFPPATIASAVCSWLRRWGMEGLTSTSPRESLDHVLRSKVIDKTLHEEIYERLMDHSLATSLNHYAEGKV